MFNGLLWGIFLQDFSLFACYIQLGISPEQLYSCDSVVVHVIINIIIIINFDYDSPSQVLL